MTTTLDIPEALLERARTAAQRRHTTLDDLVLCALERELKQPVCGDGARMMKPPIGQEGPVIAAMSNAELAAILDEEDLHKF